MSRVRSNFITNRLADGAPTASLGLIISGVTTSTTLNVDDKIVHTGDTNTAIRFPATDTITAETNGSERIRITSAGLVGIGTDTPAQPVHISRGSAVARIQSTDASTSARLEIIGANDSYSGLHMGDVDDVDVGAIRYYHAGSDPNHMSFRTNGSEKVRITSDGKVGINTDNPSRLLEINTTGTSTEGIVVKSNDNTYPKLQFGANRTNADAFLGMIIASWDGTDVASMHFETGSDTTNKDDGLISFRTASAGTREERLRIAPSGAFGLSGANYGTAGQVITSNGSSSAPTYQYVNRPAFKAIVSNQASIPHAAWTKVIFDNEVFDTDNAYNPTTGIFTCPTGQDGVYLLSYGVGVDDLQVGEYLQSRPYKNGSGINNGRTIQYAGNPHNNLVVDVRASSTIRLDAGDELAIWIYHNEGGAIPLEANRCEFNLFKLNIGDI